MYAPAMATIRHSLPKIRTAHRGNSRFSGCRKQMLTRIVFNAKMTSGKSLSAEVIRARNSMPGWPQTRHCPQRPSDDWQRGRQQLPCCSIWRARTLSRLMIRNTARAASVQMGESCLMGKRLRCLWMLRKTKADRAIWAIRHAASGHPEVYRSVRKESKDMCLILSNQT